MKTIIKVEFDGDFRVIEFTDEKGETYVVDGECTFCGICCYNKENGYCSKIIYETLNGKSQYKCSEYTTRPIGCLLWPTTIEEILNIPECTIRIRKKVE